MYSFLLFDRMATAAAAIRARRFRSSPFRRRRHRSDAAGRRALVVGGLHLVEFLLLGTPVQVLAFLVPLVVLLELVIGRQQQLPAGALRVLRNGQHDLVHFLGRYLRDDGDSWPIQRLVARQLEQLDNGNGEILNWD